MKLLGASVDGGTDAVQARPKTLPRCCHVCGAAGMEQFVKLLGANVEGGTDALQAKASSLSTEMAVVIKERQSGGGPRVVQVRA